MISFGGLFLANPGPPPRHRWIVQHPGPRHLLRRRRARLHRLSPSLRLSIQLRTYQGHPVNTRGPAPQASLSRWSGRAIRPSAASQLGHTCRPHRRRERRISRSGPGPSGRRGDTRRCTGVRIPRRGAKSARAPKTLRCTGPEEHDPSSILVTDAVSSAWPAKGCSGPPQIDLHCTTRYRC